MKNYELTYVDYINYGFFVFPCKPDKSPFTKHGFKDATNDLEKAHKQFKGHPDALIGLPTGNINGLVAIDFDTSSEFSPEELFDIVNNYFGSLPTTLKVRTPSGGFHLIYKIDSTDLTSRTRFLHKDLPIDIRANNGYIIAPGSKGYKIIEEIS